MTTTALEPVHETLAAPDALERARAALAALETPEDALRLSENADTARLFVKKIGQSQVVQNEFAEIKIRAQAKLGEIIETGIKGGDTVKGWEERLGATNITVYKARRVAMIDEAALAEYFEETRRAGADISTASALLLAPKSTINPRVHDERLKDEAKRIRHETPELPYGVIADRLGVSKTAVANWCHPDAKKRKARNLARERERRGEKKIREHLRRSPKDPRGKALVEIKKVCKTLDEGMKAIPVGDRHLVNAALEAAYRTEDAIKRSILKASR